MSSNPTLRTFAVVAGGVFMIAVGVVLVLRRPTIDDETLKVAHVVPVAAALTWLNPQALLDGAMLLGTYRAQLQAGVLLFAVGMASASATWFVSLTTGVGLARRRMPAGVLRWLSVACGLVLCGFGVRMLAHGVN